MPSWALAWFVGDEDVMEVDSTSEQAVDDRDRRVLDRTPVDSDFSDVRISTVLRVVKKNQRKKSDTCLRIRAE